MIMPSQCMLLPQYRLSPPKAQIPAYFQKVLDTRIVGATITQQLRRKVCLRPEKQAALINTSSTQLFIVEAVRQYGLIQGKRSRNW